MVFFQIMAWTNNVKQTIHFLSAVIAVGCLVSAQILDQTMVIKMETFDNLSQKIDAGNKIFKTLYYI